MLISNLLTFQACLPRNTLCFVVSNLFLPALVSPSPCLEFLPQAENYIKAEEKRLRHQIFQAHQVTTSQLHLLIIMTGKWNYFSNLKAVAVLLLLYTTFISCAPVTESCAECVLEKETLVDLGFEYLRHTTKDLYPKSNDEV